MSDAIRTVRSRIASLFERIERRSRRIPVDVEDHGERFVVRADLPGFDRRDIDVTAYSDRIHIVAANPAREGSKTKYNKRERNHGRQKRVVELPERIDGTEVSAEYRNGVLVIEASKRRPGREREIPILDSRTERADERESRLGPSDEELREYEARVDRQMDRQRDFQRDKSGQPYRRR